MMLDIDVDLLRELLRYEPETGKLFWRERASTSENRSWVRQWNARYADKEFGHVSTSNGYRNGAIFNIRYRAHRIAFALTMNVWPEGEIDHINGNRADNRWLNLRAVSRAENARNIKRHATNTSGVSGVVWHKASNKWSATIGASAGRSSYLGLFANFDDAVAARKAAETHRGYHPNHGRDAQ